MKFHTVALTLFISAVTTEAFTSSPNRAFIPSTKSSSRIPNTLRSPRRSGRNENASIRHSRRSTLHMYSVGVVGATGAVGKEIISCLEKRDFPLTNLNIFGSERSSGRVIETKFGASTIKKFDVDAARACDVVFLAVSGDFSLEHAGKISAKGGAVVIDNSSAFRYKKDVALCVPEINGEVTKNSRIVANPNCTTAIGLMALWPLHKLFKLKRVIMSTYQAASGAGQPGMDELQEGTKAVLSGERDVADNDVFAHPLPFNVIPHIDAFQENGYTKEEMKVTWETRKICDLPDDFPVSCTAVRIPTYRAHSESIVVETELPVDILAARGALEAAPGVQLVDDTTNQKYPMPLTATGKDDVEVGRLRKSMIFGDYGLELFVSGDQLLRGAALNAVLVAEEMIKNGGLSQKVIA